MIKSKDYKAVDKLCYNGCSCHNSKQARRTPKKNVKRQERRFWEKDQAVR